MIIPMPRVDSEARAWTAFDLSEPWSDTGNEFRKTECADIQIDTDHFDPASPNLNTPWATVVELTREASLHLNCARAPLYG
jgi:hypothetical protein